MTDGWADGRMGGRTDGQIRWNYTDPDFKPHFALSFVLLCSISGKSQ